jgi:hypothetical protein
MNSKILDLRFFIGGFFLIVGVLLTLHGLFVGALSVGYNLNLWAGIFFVIFGIVPVVQTFRSQGRGKL